MYNELWFSPFIRATKGLLLKEGGGLYLEGDHMAPKLIDLCEDMYIQCVHLFASLFRFNLSLFSIF